MSKNNAPLVDEKLAVSLFLDSLLREPEEAAPVVEEKPSPVQEVTYTPQARTVEEVETPPPVTEDVPEVEQAAIEEVEESTELESTLPGWTQEPFQALLFKVAGLTLAVPLVELNGVVEWTDEVTEMPGHADHYIGLLQHLDQSIPVIDTARMVLPAEKLHTFAGDNPRERVTRIVLIDNSRWGLACDEVDEVITLQPNDVRWRSAHTSRPWLLGTVIEHMCALINVPGFSNLIEIGR